MHVEYKYTFEEKEINAIKELTNINCEGVQCILCPLYIEEYALCIVNYAMKTKKQLQERGYIPWQN